LILLAFITLLVDTLLISTKISR